GYYPVEPGSYVYPAAPTAAMLSGVQHLATGGAVGKANIPDLARQAAEFEQVIGAPFERYFKVMLGSDPDYGNDWLGGIPSKYRAAVEDWGRKFEDATEIPQVDLTGVYDDAAKELLRKMGPHGGAILGDWEELKNGYWYNVNDGSPRYGMIAKGIKVEDGSYVNPDFAGTPKHYTPAPMKEDAKTIEQFLDLYREQTDGILPASAPPWDLIKNAVAWAGDTRDDENKLPSQAKDVITDLTGLLNGDRADTRGLIDNLTTQEKALADLNKDGTHPGAGIASDQVKRAINRLTTGTARTTLPDNAPQSYGLPERIYGSMSPSTPQPNTHRRTNTPNYGTSTGNVQNYTVVNTVESDRLQQLISDSQKGRVAHDHQRLSIQARSTRTVR
ncbi:MAG TPA: hypothetical protein VFQ54_01770, partial [Thermomicrobiales bacterium]|nr:hypothetical protein [Thermomicrobiales bacterium]